MISRVGMWFLAGGIALALVAAACGGPRAASSMKSRDEEALNHYRRGIVAFEQRRYADSLKELQQAVKLAPDKPEISYRLALVHYSLGEWDAAEAAVRPVVEADPYSSDARLLLGAVLSEKGQHEAALGEFKAVLADRTYTTPEKAWVNIALLYEKMGNLDEAVTAFRKALDANPKHSRAHYGLAEAFDKMNRLPEAIAEYEVASGDYEELPEFHYQYGLACFRRLKNLEKGSPEEKGQGPGGAGAASDIMALKECARKHLDTVVKRVPGTTDASRAEEILKLIR